MLKPEFLLAAGSEFRKTDGFEDQGSAENAVFDLTRIVCRGPV